MTPTSLSNSKLFVGLLGPDPPDPDPEPPRKPRDDLLAAPPATPPEGAPAAKLGAPQCEEDVPPRRSLCLTRKFARLSKKLCHEAEAEVLAEQHPQHIDAAGWASPPVLPDCSTHIWAGCTATAPHGHANVCFDKRFPEGVTVGPLFCAPRPWVFRLFTFLLDKNGQLNYNIDITEPKAWI